MTFGEQFYLTTRSPGRVAWRNLRLLGYIVFLIWTWLTLGGRVRRAKRHAEKTGEKFCIDHLASGHMLRKHEES